MLLKEIARRKIRTAHNFGRRYAPNLHTHVLLRSSLNRIGNLLKALKIVETKTCSTSRSTTARDRVHNPPKHETKLTSSRCWKIEPPGWSGGPEDGRCVVFFDRI